MAGILTAGDRQFASAIGGILYCNPFLPERISREREALGGEFVESVAEWNLRGDISADHPNVRKLLDHGEQMVERARQKLIVDTPRRDELERYEDVVLFVLYYRFRDAFDKVIESSPTSRSIPSLNAAFAQFAKAAQHFLCLPHFDLNESTDVAHLFALFFQVRRAFHAIFRNIIGISQPAAQFRAAAWQSIFTHDLRRYRKFLFDKMADITTLLTGPSGTGKDLAARAIAMAQYIPFDSKAGKFVDKFQHSYHPVNLSALTPTLIESELFGHVRGAFTGAIKDHEGLLQECAETGSVFLDEIGDLDPAIQVKLLRVLQNRMYRRVGDVDDRRFAGKIMAATNRDLAGLMRAGRFREDLYYRLCADILVAPSLEERLRDHPEELPNLVLFIAARVAEPVAESLAEEVTTYIREHIGLDYPWPGNVRELEQCVRNVLVRGKYAPPRATSARFDENLAQDLTMGSLTVAELMRRYCTLVYSRIGNFEEAARKLGVDRRTIKAHVDMALLGRNEMRGEKEEGK